MHLGCYVVILGTVPTWSVGSSEPLRGLLTERLNREGHGILLVKQDCTSLSEHNLVYRVDTRCRRRQRRHCCQRRGRARGSMGPRRRRLRRR